MRLCDDFIFVLDGFQGDADWIAAVFALKRVLSTYGLACPQQLYPRQCH